MNIRRILTSLVVVGVVAGAAIGGATAFFSDTETSVGNSLTAGEIDLIIDGEFSSLYNGSTGGFEFPEGNETGLFAFTDLKPGDFGGGYVEMSATSNEYWACVGLTNLLDEENVRIEPELPEDTTDDDGELDDYLTIAVWQDGNDNGTYESGSDTLLGGSPFLANTLSATPWLPLADASGAGPFGSTPLSPGTDYNIYMTYCFGSFDTELVCTPVDGEGENVAMTDSLTGDLEFYAVQSRNNTDFTCDSMNEPEGPVVVEGFNADAVKEAQVRYRNFRPTGNGWDIGIGTDVGVPGFFGDTDWGGTKRWYFEPTDEENLISWTYDPDDGTITTTVTTDASYIEEYTTGNLGDLNYMQWLVRGATGQTVAFNDVELTVGGNTFPLGDFSQTSSTTTWSFSNFDLSDGFTLTGKIELTGVSTGQEQAKVDVSVHELP